MENEVSLEDVNLNEQLLLKDKNIFKLDYENQNVNNNINYLYWKDSILKKYGNDIKIFKCNKCKILFYSQNEDIIKGNYYSMLCPICKLYICYFCSTSFDKYDDVFCCKRRVINICFSISGPEYTKGINLCDLDIILFLIPFMNILGLSYCLNRILYFSIPRKKPSNKGKLTSYEGDNIPVHQFMIFLVPLVLGIPYFIIDAYHLIFLFLISIPFKIWPLKYYLGFFDIKLKYFGDIY